MKNKFAIILCNYLSNRVILWLFCLLYGISIGLCYDKLNLGLFTDLLVNNITVVDSDYGN